jgi:E3 ubiquitin-protein ligase RNF14
MHEDESCDEYTARIEHNVEERASHEKVARLSKPCPKCRSKISKAGGCDHMTCEYIVLIVVFSRQHTIPC